MNIKRGNVDTLMSSVGWSEVDCVRECSKRHAVVTGVVGMESDLTLERNCRMWSMIDHETILIVIECEESRGQARHRKGVKAMNDFKVGLDLECQIRNGLSFVW